MRICEYRFEGPSLQNSRYSDYEADFYSWSKLGDPTNHRLSLRKNLVSGKFEVYRSYSNGNGDEVAFMGTLMEVYDFANEEVFRFHSNHTLDEICNHDSHA